MESGNDVKNIINILIKKMEKNELMINSFANQINEIDYYSKMTRELYIKNINDEIKYNDIDCIKKLFVTNTPSIDEIYNNPIVYKSDFYNSEFYNLESLFG